MLVMRELEGLSYDKISSRTGLSRSAVESVLFRARRRLKDEFDDISTGERCPRDADHMAKLAERRIGIREERRLSGHLQDCAACRREAVAMGLDDVALGVATGRVALGAVAGGLVPAAAGLPAAPVARRASLARLGRLAGGRAGCLADSQGSRRGGGRGARGGGAGVAHKTGVTAPAKGGLWLEHHPPAGRGRCRFRAGPVQHRRPGTRHSGGAGGVAGGRQSADRRVRRSGRRHRSGLERAHRRTRATRRHSKEASTRHSPRQDAGGAGGVAGERRGRQRGRQQPRLDRRAGHRRGPRRHGPSAASATPWASSRARRSRTSAHLNQATSRASSGARAGSGVKLPSTKLTP